jgi:hypothetical protein
VDTALPCPDCGYELRGLIVADAVTCPECGGRWGRADIELARRQSLRKLMRRLLLTPVVMAGAGMVVAMFAGFSGEVVILASLVVAPGSGFAWALVWERRTRILSADPGAPAWEHGVVILCSVLMAMVVTMIGMTVAYPAVLLVVVFLR